MSIRGEITIECDQQCCHAEIVLQGTDFNLEQAKRGTILDIYAFGWQVDDGFELFICPQCAEGDPREKDADDGRTYSDPRDARDERL